MFGFPHLRTTLTDDQLAAYAKANAAATGHDEDLVEAKMTSFKRQNRASITITVTFTILDLSGSFSKESIIAALKDEGFQEKLNAKIAEDSTISIFQITGTAEPTSKDLGKLYIIFYVYNMSSK